jgi:hypothetical protein
VPTQEGFGQNEGIEEEGQHESRACVLSEETPRLKESSHEDALKQDGSREHSEKRVTCLLRKMGGKQAAEPSRRSGHEEGDGTIGVRVLAPSLGNAHQRVLGSKVVGGMEIRVGKVDRKFPSPNDVDSEVF